MLAAGPVARVDKVEGYTTSSRQELKVALGEINDNDTQKDLVLRRELDEMSRQVAQGHDGLVSKLDALSPSVAISAMVAEEALAPMALLQASHKSSPSRSSRSTGRS